MRSFVRLRAFAFGIATALVAAACGGSRGELPAATAAAPATSSGQYAYVVNTTHGGPSWASEIDVYPAALNGNISPSTVIGGSNTMLTQAGGDVVDSTGEIYVANSDTDNIVGFAPGSSGNVAPNIVIGGSYTQLSRPTGLALDSSGNIYVANCASGCGVGSAPSALLEFAAGSNGNVAPIRNISGYNSQLTNANDTAVDSSGDIYVSNYISSTIDVFDSNANGDVSPTRVLAGSKTLLSGPEGILVDKLGLYAGGAFDQTVERFRPTANGNVPPRAVISGHRTLLGDTDGIAFDAKGNVYASSPTNQRVLKFGRTANGDVRPFGKIAGSNTRLVEPVWVFVK